MEPGRVRLVEVAQGDTLRVAPAPRTDLEREVAGAAHVDRLVAAELGEGLEAPHRERRDDDVGRQIRRRVEVPGEPAVGGVVHPGRSQLHPVHRVEVTALVRRHSARLDHRHSVVLVEREEGSGGWMEGEGRLPVGAIDRTELVRVEVRGGDLEVRSRGLVVATIGSAERHDQVQAVLAAAQEEHDQDLVVEAAGRLGECHGVEARAREGGDGCRATHHEAAARGLTFLIGHAFSPRSFVSARATRATCRAAQ